MKVFAVLPCFKSIDTACFIAKECINYVDHVVCIDDNCPYGTGKKIEKYIKDEKITVLYHKLNKGVGGATKTGIIYSLEKGADIIIKIDSDGQMLPELIPKLLKPILSERAEFTKGNRFKEIDIIKKMPKVRLIGNIGLSFLTKLSTGYWELFDPTNGFLAIHQDVFKKISLNKIDNRYFFETDLLFRCSLSDVVINEVTISAIYKNEKSGLKPFVQLFNFLIRHIIIFFKRILYQYFLLDFNPGSLSIIVSFFLGLISISMGIFYFVKGTITSQQTEFGIQILFLLLTIISSQFFINFIYYDSSQKPMLRKLKLLKN